VRGYEVVTSDQRVVGRVADVRDGYLIVEAGRLHKSRWPVPREFVHAVDEAAKVFVTVPRRVLQDAPEADGKGHFDLEEAARHYGLAAAFGQFDDAPENRRMGIRRHRQPGIAREHELRSPALFGELRLEVRRLEEDY
jgi:hypothetical protein